MIIIAGFLLVDEADQATYVEAHRDLVTRARAFDGCIDLSISADPLDPRRINNIEIWRDRDALDAWRKQADAPNTGVEFRGGSMQRYNAEDGGPVF